MKKVNPKSDAQPNLPEVLQNTSSSEFSDVSERSTEELDDKSFPTNIQSQVQNSPDASDIVPPTNDDDQFGMIGLLSRIQASNRNPNLVAMGMNLNELGLNLNTQGSLYGTFDGPFSNVSCLPPQYDYPIPLEYMVNCVIRDKLPGFTLSRFKDDVLFFLFYGCVGDCIQLQSAVELYRRNWRFNVEEKVWMYKIPGVANYKKIGSIEQGIFYYFDPKIWRRVLREFQFDSDKIEKWPSF